MFGEEIISIIFGGSKFFLIIVSNPLPIETIKKVCGMIPIIVANKKFLALTLKGMIFQSITSVMEIFYEGWRTSLPICVKFG